MNIKFLLYLQQGKNDTTYLFRLHHSICAIGVPSRHFTIILMIKRTAT
jgi:hypothetical protein